MKTLRNIFISPIAIAVAVVHWIVVIYAMFGDEVSEIHIPYIPPELFQWLILLDIPAIAFTYLICSPAVYFLGFGNWIYTPVAVIFITSQWLLISRLVEYFVDSMKPEEVKISLNNNEHQCSN